MKVNIATCSTDEAVKAASSAAENLGYGVGTLVGQDSNAFALLGYVRDVLTDVGWKPFQIDRLFKIARSSDYIRLVAVLDAVLKPDPASSNSGKYPGSGEETDLEIEWGDDEHENFFQAA